MLTRLIANTISGAAVGYITNDLAIKMLFEKKLGLGGLIIDTKDVFIEKISQLVEREVVNHRTLKKEIEGNQIVFEQNLQNTIEDFFANHLFEKLSKSFQIGDIPYIRLTTDYLRTQADNALIQTVPALLDYTGSHVYLTDLISPPQLVKVSNSLTGLLIGSIKDERLLKETLLNFYQDFENVPFNELVDDEFWKQVSENTAAISADLHLVLRKEFDSKIDTLLRDIIHSLKTNDLVKSLAKDLSKKKIHELLGLYYTNALAEELLKRINDIASSPDGAEMLDQFAGFIINTLEKEDSTIFDLLSADLAESTRGFLREKMPFILSSLIDWVQEKRQKLETLIDETFKDNVPSGLKAMVLNMFVVSVSQSADVMKKVVEMLQTYQRNPNETAEKFTEKVIEYLQENKIGDIVKRIKNNAKGMNLHDILVAGLKHGLKQIRTEEIAVFFEKKIGELTPKSEIEDFLQNGLNKLLNAGLKEKLLYSPVFSNLVAEELKKQVLLAGNRTLGQIIDKDRFTKLAESLSTQFIDLATTNESRIANYLHNIFENQLVNKKLDYFLTSQWQAYLTPKITQKGSELVYTQIDKALKIPIHDLKNLANNKSAMLSTELNKLLINNLENITKGKIEDIVASRLQKMDDSALKNIVQKFMGEELKPITILGAWLGGLSGAMLYFLPTPDNVYAYSGLAALVYGITGWGTNWQAIKMVFRPHKAYFVGGIQVPFTPGILAKNQAKFAGNMGNFVANHLLNEEILKLSFESNKDRSYQAIHSLVAKNNYELINNLFVENKTKIAEALAAAPLPPKGEALVSESFLSNLTQKGFDILFNPADDKELLAKLDTQKIEQKIIEATEQVTFRHQAIEQASIGLQKFTSKDKAVYEIIPENLRNNIKTLLQEWTDNKIGDFFENIRNAEKQSDVITQLEPQFLKYKRLGLDRYLEDTQKTAIMLNVSKFIHEKLIDNEIRQLLFDFVDVRLATELAPERKLNELLDGRLMAMVNDNLDFIMDNVLDMGVAWLKTHRKQIADDVYKMAVKKNPAVFFYQSTIKNTVLELADTGIPNFFAEEKQSLQDLIAVQAQTIGMSKLSDLQVQLDKAYLKDLLEKFLVREEMLLSVQNFSYSILKEMFKIPVSVFLQVAGVANMKDLQRILSAEINIITRHLQQQGREKQHEIGNKLSGFVIEILENKLQKTTVKEIFAKIDSKTYQLSAQRIVTHLLQSNTFNVQKEQFISRFFAQVKQSNLSGLVDKSILEKDILTVLHKVLSSDDTKQFLQHEIKQTAERLLENLPEHISTETKEFLTKHLIEGILAAIENNLSPLINSIDLKKMVVEEIKGMQPAEIEKLFYSFADTYFTKLINYGFGFGIVFGLISEAILFYGLKTVNGGGE
jgi:uncharacterized membrane protein YheB (UPF0754 family)